MKSSIFSLKSAFFICSWMILGKDFDWNTHDICLTKKKNCKYTAVFPLLSRSAHVFKSLSWLIALQALHSLHAFMIMHGPLGLHSPHMRSINWRRSSAKLLQHVSAGETANAVLIPPTSNVRLNGQKSLINLLVCWLHLLIMISDPRWKFSWFYNEYAKPSLWYLSQVRKAILFLCVQAKFLES